MIKSINQYTVQILNMILKHNEGSIELLKRYKGKSFYIALFGISVGAKINNTGFLEHIKINNSIKNSQENPILSQNFTTHINIPISTVTYAIDQDKLKTFKKIVLSGDKSFGRDILEIFSKLQFTNLYSGSNPISILIINKIYHLLKMIKMQHKLISNNLGHSISEYLQFETRDIVNQFEIDNFCDQVDHIKSRTELLIKKLAQLELINSNQ